MRRGARLAPHLEWLIIVPQTASASFFSMNPLLLDFPDEIRSERLLIRAPRAGDGALLNASIVESLDELRPWMPWAQTCPTIEESEEVCRRAYLKFLAREDLMLLLFSPDMSTHIGGSGLHRIDWSTPRFEIGYWLRTSFCGQGLMTEAVGAITNFAFETLHAQRVEIHCDDLNLRSARVATRCGFALESIRRRDSRDHEGRLRDARVYVRLAQDSAHDESGASTSQQSEAANGA